MKEGRKGRVVEGMFLLGEGDRIGEDRIGDETMVWEDIIPILFNPFFNLSIYFLSLFLSFSLSLSIPFFSLFSFLVLVLVLVTVENQGKGGKGEYK